jgi:hypothetical protein
MRFESGTLDCQIRPLKAPPHPLIVCVCKGHHGWKKWNETRYNEIVRALLPADRVALWDKAHAARYQPTRMFTSDWMKEEVALKQELRAYQAA